MFGNSNDETNFPHKLLFTNTQVSRVCKAFANNSSANIKLLKTQLSKIVQLGGFLDRILEPLLETDFPLNLQFLVKNNAFTQSNSVRAVLKIL